MQWLKNSVQAAHRIRFLHSVFLHDTMLRRKNKFFVSVGSAVVKPDFAKIFQPGNFRHKLPTQKLPDLVFWECIGRLFSQHKRATTALVYHLLNSMILHLYCYGRHCSLQHSLMPRCLPIIENINFVHLSFSPQVDFPVDFTCQNPSRVDTNR